MDCGCLQLHDLPVILKQPTCPNHTHGLVFLSSLWSGDYHKSKLWPEKTMENELEHWRWGRITGVIEAKQHRSVEMNSLRLVVHRILSIWAIKYNKPVTHLVLKASQNFIPDIQIQLEVVKAALGSCWWFIIVRRLVFNEQWLFTT